MALTATNLVGDGNAFGKRPTDDEMLVWKAPVRDGNVRDGNRLALSLPRDPVPDPRGGLAWAELHERPFRPDEAAELLAAAGIPCERIVSRRVAEWQDLCDPETGRGPVKGQVVVALMRTDGETLAWKAPVKGWKEDGSQARAVHLAFAWDEEAKAWRLARAMAEVPI